MSAETMNSAPACRWSRTLSWPMRTETAASDTEKVPPKPQHSSGRAGAAKRIPATPSSSVRAFDQDSPWISLIEAACRWRIALQLLCSPTVCSKRAQGNARTPSTSCRNSVNS